VLSSKKIVLYFFIGLTVLMLGAKLMVYGATGVAKFFGLSDFIIGLTVVAIGTSLPELAAIICADMKLTWITKPKQSASFCCQHLNGSKHMNTSLRICLQK